MNVRNGWNSVKKFLERVGRRNLIITGAVLLIGTAVLLNWMFFTTEKKNSGYDYDASAGMSTNYGTTLTTTAVGDDSGKPTDAPSSTDAYFASVEVSRRRARDEALEVLNAVVKNDQAPEEVKADAMKEIQTMAKEMAQETNIESVLKGKGFAQCVAVISGDSANIVVQHEGTLQGAELAQINAVVFEETGIEPAHITIVQKG